MGRGGDIEMGNGGALYPNMIESPQLRWAFIRKVYSIVAMQILLTAVVAAAVVFVRPVHDFLLSGTGGSLAVAIVIMISPIIVMIPMICLRDKHPWNLLLLLLFTVCISFSVGIACLTAKGRIIMEAAVLTAVVVVSLTLYTFWAAKRGHDFSFLGPFLFAAVLVLMFYSLVQIFFPMGKVGTTIYGCIAALVFAGFIVYDTDDLIKRHSYDEYVMAAISLYLDIINLFMSILMILEGSDG